MKGLPGSEVYEQELEFIPYRESLQQVHRYVCCVPPMARLLDVMCGPGYLLGQIEKSRPDVVLAGVDIDERYIGHATNKYPRISFTVGDIRTLHPEPTFDVVLCTGSLHHLPYEHQEAGIERIAGMVKPDGFVVLSDCYIGSFTNEAGRKLAAAKLGYEYLRATIQNGAPPEIVQEMVDILGNDVMMREFKTSLDRRLPILQTFFGDVQTNKTWPKFASDYGDYISVCRNPQQF
jgi:SAM-dependent methyltransferase